MKRKVVYNSCFGGFGLSDEAIIRYNELMGRKVWFVGDNFKRQAFLSEPSTEFIKWINRDFRIKTKNKLLDEEMSDWCNKNYFDQYELSRHDSLLVQTVEELGSKKASGNFAELAIEEVYGSYRIDEYDGNERVMTASDYDWID